MPEILAIHETAFMTSSYRSSNINLSKDEYVGLWNNDKTDVWVKDLLKEVSPHEPTLHCLRNRYFFETIKRLYEKEEIHYLINFGCGFSMYPFLLSENLKHIEIDTDQVINYKKEKIKRWQEKGQLPFRNIKYLRANFEDKDFSELKSKILSITQEAPSFILLEGVQFFLHITDSRRLFQLYHEIQQTSGYIGAVSFRKEEASKAVFQRLIQFFKNRIDSNFTYQLVGDSFYTNQRDYTLIEHKDDIELSKQFDPDAPILNDHDILNEHMYLLQKKAKNRVNPNY